MNIGDSIKNKHELYIFTIFDNFTNILQYLRNINKSSFDLDNINYNNNEISNDDYAIKIFTSKINNFKKNGLQSFHSSHPNKKVIFIIENISLKLYTEIVQSHDNIEIFLIEDLFHNLIHNVLQPKYELLTNEEKNVLKKNYDIYNENLIPKIKKSDIIVRFFNAKVNDILKITRYDNYYGKDIYYRIVVDSNYDDIFS